MEMTAQRRWLHRYAILVACATFVLIIAGALVTSNDAALSIPSWPLPLHWPSAMGPGGRFELTHRIIAGTVSALTVLLALWLWRSEPRRWVRRLGAVAVLAIMAQAVLGGITVLFELPVAISVSHACLGQAFFCIVVSLALFTGSDWRWDEAALEDRSAPSLRQISTATTAAIFLQLMLGAAFRHKGIGIIPHIIGAGLVTVGVLWLLARVLGAYSQEPRLKRPTLLLGALLVVQLFLGIASYILRVAAVNAPQPLPPLVDVTTTHVAIGALVLVTSLVVTLQAFRLVKGHPRTSEVRSQGQEVRMTAG
ncbi:MAG TPA: COX15/CtaA family protein [Terriglobia bacterium]|nr:COX15/CtaA family protein [Terriglobia bacterium]